MPDSLFTLIEAGLSLDEIRKSMDNGLSLDEQLAAVQNLQSRGES